MKSSIEVMIIASVAILGGVGNWAFGGRPPAEADSELAERPLKAGEVRLQDLKATGFDGVVWIDARSEKKWKADGLPGSLNINGLAEESLVEQVARHAEQLLEARKVVVYCGNIHCTLSHELADRLRDLGLIEGEILVLNGGITALRRDGQVPDSN